MHPTQDTWNRRRLFAFVFFHSSLQLQNAIRPASSAVSENSRSSDSRSSTFFDNSTKQFFLNINFFYKKKIYHSRYIIIGIIINIIIIIIKYIYSQKY